MAKQTPATLSAKAVKLIAAIEAAGVHPATDPADLLLLSLIPLAIKKVKLGDPWSDVEMLNDVLNQLDLSGLAEYLKK